MADADPLPRLQAVIVAAFPKLAGGRFTLSPRGWDSLAVDDAAAERLNGVYDFGDSGFCGLHQEFIYANLCAFDLTDRIVASYEDLTGRALDRQRIHLLTGVHGLTELDGSTPAGLEAGLARLERWAARSS